MMDEPNAAPDPGSVLLDLFGPHTTDEDLQVKESIFPQVEIDPPSAEEAKDKSPCSCLHGEKTDEGVGGTSSAVVNKCTCDSDSKVYPKSGSTVRTVEESGAVLESKVVIDCVSGTSENELLLQEIQYVGPPSNEFGSCKGDETDLRTNICSENPNQDGALLEPHDRSDGSDSGLGSELAEELVASAQADCSIDDLCIQITRHVAEQKKSLFLNNSEGRSAEMQPQPVSNPVVSNNDANQVSNTLDVKTPTSDYDTQTETSELSLDDDVTNKLNSESINLGIMPNRASEHNGSSMAANIFPQELVDMENIVSKEQSASEHGNDEECERKELRTALRSTLKRTHSENICDEPRPKKKKSISFDSVSVFYFPRTQGFTCVPSQGGSTLGMAQAHSHIHRFSISEHALEQRRVHRQMMLQLRHDRLSQGTPPSSSSSSSGTTGGGVHISSSEDSDSEEEPSDASESELDVDSYYFLQPVPTRQRRALLRAAGVHRIDSVEKDECKDIRSSREMCGCACKTYCDPDTCSCSQSGIKCQVDRVNFPCGCSRDGCANTSGRIEFNPMRVRTHFIHTLMRLELEKKQRAVEEDSAQSEQTTWSCSTPSFSAAPSEQSKFPEVPTATLAGTEADQPATFPATHYGPDREDSLDLYPFSEESKNTETLPYSNLRKPHAFTTPSQESFPFSQEPAVHPFNASTAHGYPFNYPNSAGLSHDNQYGRQQPFAGFSLFNNALPSVCSFNYSSVYSQEFPAKQMGTEVFENGAFKTGDYMNQNGNNNGDCYNFPVGGAVTGSAATGEETKGPAPAAATVPSAAAAAAAAQYTNLHTVCQLGSNKLEPFSGLLQGRYPYLTPASSSEAGESASAPMDQTQACSQMQVDVFRSEGSETANGEAVDANAPADKGDDCSDENFGEIIKKTMVETVSA